MLKQKLLEIVGHAVEKAFPELPVQDILIEYPNEGSHGDYSCPIALQLAKKVGDSPRTVAESLMENMEKPSWIHSLEIAGPGFINFFISPLYLIENVKTILKKGTVYGCSDTKKKDRILIEYSSPNTNKPLHLGHARNNVLGMALAKLLEANGHEVIKTQNMNDRGIHICKSMAAYRRVGRNTSPESLERKSDHFVGDYYVKYAQILAEDPSIEEEAKTMLKQWEEADPEVRNLWGKMNAWALKGFETTYATIGSHFNNTTFESDISENGRALIEKALEEGKVERVEGGAIAMDLSAEGLGDPETGRKILIRSDGTTMYITQDIQLAVQRMKDGNIDRIIYVVGNEQDYHFKVLFKILEKLGYDWAKQCHHLSYGMVDLPTGKMKSREGTTVDIDNMLEELETLVDKELAQRELKYDDQEKHHLRESIALAALKYYLLKVDAKSRMIYDPASSLDFQGDTGPYLQYTHARIHSILKRVDDSKNDLSQEIIAEFLEEPEELALLRKLQLYPEWIAECADSYRIHPLALYLNELAQELNIFYAKHTVLNPEISSEKRAARLQLIAAVAQVLKNGLKILGIEAVERM
ncbi:MAG: hypothetical protein ACD_28C00016G0008 [uncultured bacterium]|nr:MAG: hypothetical protein ACD_28C00016G0008 [uncultured bacterium]KKT74857.1 MAG: Arginine-tRNA ligase [Candidatus Peregrinibacteria bacterium GW2011_GWA2_44_7]